MMATPKTLVLMNKNTPVMSLEYDDELHVFTKIMEIKNPEYMPPGVISGEGTPNRRTLNSWWQGRSIPASRRHIQEICHASGHDNMLILAEKSFGLSLSDRYWLNDPASPMEYKDINFFDNPFTEDLGLVTLGQSSASPRNLYSPNSTLNGDLQKKWTIQDGVRILIKAGTGIINQEPYNEVIATALYKRLLDPQAYVPYSLHEERRRTYCACPNMLGEDEELVPMYDLLQSHKKSSSENDLQFTERICGECGIEDPLGFLTRMFTCDFILGNSDRHWRNFGLIRNVETLRYTRMAPIFDTGHCLWCDVERLDSPQDYAYMAKPFGRDGMPPAKQLKLFHGREWFREASLQGFAEEAAAILAQNPNLPEKRIEQIIRGMRRNMEYVRE
ncbi:MAG: hypothetical protein NC548_33505 [Lachnospiraceae bacterium]|nr:hypothetical protein [Lachnospiraceae bacterium]